MKYVYNWRAENVEHIGLHGVTPIEAEYVVEHAADPYPEELTEKDRKDRYLVHGPSGAGRLLQVIYVLKWSEDVDYEELTLEQIAEIAEDRPLAYIYHARDLNEREKRRYRRTRR